MSSLNLSKTERIDVRASTPVKQLLQEAKLKQLQERRHWQYAVVILLLLVMGMLALIVLPSVYVGRRVRRLSRASQDRVADTSAIAAEVLNAIPVVQSYTQQRRESARFEAATERAFDTAVRRTPPPSLLFLQDDTHVQSFYRWRSWHHRAADS